MTINNQTLVTKLNVYGSQLDEDMMFAWLDKIPVVSEYRGKGVELHIDLKIGEVDDYSLRELVSLFFRYGLDMSSLKEFETSVNKQWFRDPQAYWYSYVFEGKEPVHHFGDGGKIWWQTIVNKIKT